MPRPTDREIKQPASQLWWHLAFLLLLSAGFEVVFVGHGLNALDEGWPLYAAMQLHDGGTLYRDVFFVFPPGHVLSAWLAYALDPPGVLLARSFYAGFNVALCLALYLLGRRLMPPAAALLGATMLAVGAPHSHGAHYLFGYRYFVFSVVALWCFSERIRSRDPRWMLVAGAFTGVALVFRLTPAAAALAGIGAGMLVAHASWRRVFDDAVRFAVGFGIVVMPVVFWLLVTVGPGAAWHEIVVRPVVMTDLQSLPVPALEWSTPYDRMDLRTRFVNLQFRLYPLLYAGYAVFLGVRWLRDRRAGRAFDSPLLLAVVVWGGLYLSRAYGRADEAHLDSVLPAACLLMAHAWSTLLRSQFATNGSARSRLRVGAALALSLSLWIYLTSPDFYVRFARWHGLYPIQALGGETRISPNERYRALDPVVRHIRSRSNRGDVILDLSASPLVHVLSERRGPGGPDMIMPGTFATPEEERRFIERVEAAEPKLVLMPRWIFDDMPSRAIGATAPELLAWVQARYEPIRDFGDFTLLRERHAGASSR
jgi:hypothetical protein